MGRFEVVLERWGGRRSREEPESTEMKWGQISASDSTGREWRERRDKRETHEQPRVDRLAMQMTLRSPTLEIQKEYIWR